jgi:hypothetical protein
VGCIRICAGKQTNESPQKKEKKLEFIHNGLRFQTIVPFKGKEFVSEIKGNFLFGMNKKSLI